MEKLIEKLKFEKYPTYKDSKAEWIGIIPEHWEVVPGFTLVEERKEKNKGFIEKTILSLSYGNVIVKPEEKLTGLVPESFETYQLVYPGDIIIRPTDLQNDKTSLRTGLAKNKGIITSAYINLRIKNGFSSAFYHYFLHSVDITKVIYGMGSGLRQNLDFGDFKRFSFLLPPKKEQEDIVTFLDRKTAQIDKAISIKEKQIELLKERRQILIHRAVTRGLDPNVKMKDSGVEWIGEIPEHWEVKRLKFLCHITTGSKNTEDKIDGGKYPFFVRSQTPEAINSYSFDGEAILTAGDGAGVGKVFHYINGKFDFHQRVYKFSMFSEIEGLYLFHYIQSNFFNVANLGTAKSTVDSLRLPLIQDFLVSFPLNIKEQEEIIYHIENAGRKISSALSIKEKEIEKLREYKATLINSAVTGKIKVV